MTAQSFEAFYVCVYFEKGEAIGHRGGFDSNFPDTLDGSEANKEQIPKIKRSGMRDISKNFISSMMGYLEYVPIILTLTPTVSHRMVSQSLQTFLESKCSSCERGEDRVIYQFDLHDAPAIRRFEENLSAATSTSRSLPRLLTVGLVTSLEYHINLVMKELAATNPNSVFSKEKSIPVREAVNYSSIEELRETLINDEIDKAQRDTFENQIKWIIGRVDGMDDFTPHYAEWPEILELFERRNLFVHANGTVNEHYLRASKKYKFKDKTERNLGDELHAGPKYFTASVHNVIHFGAMFLQVIWRKLAPTENRLADQIISDLGYELIAKGQYKLAIRILEFAKNLRDVSDDAKRRMNIVNLACAHNLSGDQKASLKTLDSMDWSAVAPEFKISVAAVKGDIQQVVDLMTKLGKNGDMRAQFYQDWPAFYSVREDPLFSQAFSSIFGIDYIPSSKKQAGLPQVMEWIDQQGLRAKSRSSASTDGNEIDRDNIVSLRPKDADITYQEQEEEEE